MQSRLMNLISKIYTPSQYSSIREEVYRLISEYKRSRYVPINERVTVLFEDAATVWFQIEETAYLEGVDDINVVREAVKTYAPMVPGSNELTITVFININNYDELRNLLPKYNGIEKSIKLVINNVELEATPIYPEDYAPGSLPRSIHYLKVTGKGLDDLIKSSNSVKLRITHPMVNKEVTLSNDSLEAIRASLKGINWVI
ncbi:DUF3501 family protein [Caldivirga maquilingensis]|uniref:Uncharacterized protein n=1 Tax=Caldivirga maquilingensis (strain ATCC 700844 / DSM 13496 / JCM 10307 / IC-167) TaxID=397948 RepID=A8M9N3_CALMQ|nr:DUF3501 family protein [Caldivirga maquilingensis]ABW00914.1 hypothetical protein Cmaq_0060 [Caldivirga maquilingensis IC-167]